MFTPAETNRKGLFLAALVTAGVLCLIGAAFSAGRLRPVATPTPPVPDERTACWSRGGTTLATADGPVCIDRRAVL